MTGRGGITYLLVAYCIESRVMTVKTTMLVAPKHLNIHQKNLLKDFRNGAFSHLLESQQIDLCNSGDPLLSYLLVELNSSENETDSLAPFEASLAAVVLLKKNIQRCLEANPHDRTISA